MQPVGSPTNAQVLLSIGIAAVYIPCALSCFEVMLTGKNRWADPSASYPPLDGFKFLSGMTVAAVLALWVLLKKPSTS